MNLVIQGKSRVTMSHGIPKTSSLSAQEDPHVLSRLAIRAMERSSHSDAPSAGTSSLTSRTSEDRVYNLVLYVEI